MLTSLDLTCCRIGHDGFMKLITAINLNESLLHLRVKYHLSVIVFLNLDFTFLLFHKTHRKGQNGLTVNPDSLYNFAILVMKNFAIVIDNKRCIDNKRFD